MADEQPDHDDVMEHARERSHDRSESVEDMLNRAAELLGEQMYPVTSEELATEYADEAIDLPNETESLGSVVDRLVDERFESRAEAREALFGELTGQAGPEAEDDEQRDLTDRDEEPQDDLADGGSDA
jgi:hypothetical protein